MLYVTTRDKYDAYTAARALQPGRAPDGGFYQPYRMPQPDAAQVQRILEKPFSQCVAEVLNLFFPGHFTGWDVEFCVGRYPVRMTFLGSKILVAETWHNLEDRYAMFERNICEKICGACDKGIPSWVAIAIRIAVLFGVFSELKRSSGIRMEKPVDMSVPSGDFSVLMAVWHARKMGLPIGNIICSCNDNTGAWDLIHLGQLNTGAVAVKTTSPEADFAVPEHLERLIFNTLGADEVMRFCQACRQGGMYTLPNEHLDTLRHGLYAAVISQERLNSVISNVERTAGYVLGPYEALAYGGLMDYRAKTGDSSYALLLAERSPSCDGALVASALQITQQELQKMLK
ncbi:MAG: hypothetical protein ACI4PO_01750 [Faecousia sp.]